MQSIPNEARHQKRHNTPLLFLVLLCLLAIASSALFYTKYQHAQNTPENQQKQLVSRVSRLVVLPDTAPTIVTIANKAKLTNKALAAHVQNKDALLIYDAAKRIIVYRPSLGKVVDMLSFNAQEAVPQNATQP